MEAHCIDVERIGDIAGLEADHPLRRHAEACPRCGSLLASYREFAAVRDADGSNVERARPHLDARIRSDAKRWVSGHSYASTRSRTTGWRALLRPAPVFAAASIAVAVAFLFTNRGRDTGVLRDDTAIHAAVELHPAFVADDGTIRLSWSAMTGADSYQVRIYGPDLSEIVRLSDIAETTTTVARSALPPDLPPSLDLTWRVYALSGGDEIEASEPGSIRDF